MAGSAFSPARVYPTGRLVKSPANASDTSCASFLSFGPEIHAPLKGVLKRFAHDDPLTF
jgi:hypothetical protein